jgi:hypothetical protein
MIFDTVRDKTDGPASGRYDLPNVAKIVPNCAGDRYSTHTCHLFKSIPQSVVLPFQKCLYKNVSVLRT